MSTTIPEQIVRCTMFQWFNNKQNKQQTVSEKRNQFYDGAIPYLIQYGNFTERQAIDLLNQMQKDISMERTLPGTIPLALQICACTGFIAGIINGIIMVTTGFHYFFTMMFLICSILVYAPISYRRKHQIEYQIVNAWEKCAPDANSIFTALEKVHSQVSI